jgi:hypothetical protein
MRRQKTAGSLDVLVACRKWLRDRDLSNDAFDFRFSRKANHRSQLPKKELTPKTPLSNSAR